MRLDIPALIVPGHDAAHATSAARYLEECIPRSDYWDVAVEQQTEANVPQRVIEFLRTSAPLRYAGADKVSGASVTLCKASSVRPGTISLTAKPSSVTSMTARLV